MKSFDVYGLGNAVVDITARVSDTALEQLHFPKKSVRAISAVERDDLLARYGGAGAAAWTAAGSAANSVVVAADLHGKAALAGRIGDDRLGRFYSAEFEKLNVHFGNPLVLGGETGTVICLVTPDGERTMPFNLGVAADFSPRDLERAMVRASQWVFIEAYLLANGGSSQEAVLQAVRCAKELSQPYRAQVALSLAAPEVVRDCREIIDEILPYTDLLFANRDEALEFAQTDDFDLARRRTVAAVPNYVITDGPHGAFVRHGGKELQVPAFPGRRIDATGAGDTFAGGYIYGITHGCTPLQAANGASALAAKVIEQFGARLAAGTRAAWDAALGG